jgi:hypothetical protein
MRSPDEDPQLPLPLAALAALEVPPDDLGQALRLQEQELEEGGRAMSKYIVTSVYENGYCSSLYYGSYDEACEAFNRAIALGVEASEITQGSERLEFFAREPE